MPITYEDSSRQETKISSTLKKRTKRKSAISITTMQPTNGAPWFRLMRVTVAPVAADREDGIPIPKPHGP